MSQFGNDQQFSATLFELRCANFCYVHFPNIKIQFSPSVTLSGTTKHPDFKIIHPTIDEVFCECKSLMSVNKIKQNRTLKLAECIKEELQSIDIPQHVRVEIFFEKLPRHFNRNLGDQLKGAIRELIRLKKFGIERKFFLRV